MSVISNVGNFLVKNSTKITAGLSIVGVISTAGLAISATPKALKILEDAQELVDEGRMDELTKVDKIKLTYKHYIPTVVSAAFTIGCIVYGDRLNAKQNAAIAAMYSATDIAFKEYQKKIITNVGKEMHQKVTREVAQEKKVVKAVAKHDSVIFAGDGDVLCYDEMSGRPFNCNIEKIRESANNINDQLRSEMTVILNDFYNEIGLTSIPLGENTGWDIEKGPLKVTFESMLIKGKPAVAIIYDVEFDLR